MSEHPEAFCYEDSLIIRRLPQDVKALEAERDELRGLVKDALPEMHTCERTGWIKVANAALEKKP